MSRKRTALDRRAAMGNPGRRPTPKATVAAPPKPPKAPSWLSGEALVAWKRLVPAAWRLGRLTDLDLPMIIATCAAIGDLARIERALADAEPGEARRLLSLAAKARADLLKASEALGLDPLSRSRIPAAEPPTLPEPASTNRYF